MVLRPGGADGPAFTGSVTVLAPLAALRQGGACPGDGDLGPAVDGTPITAGQLRELLAELGALGVQAPPGGSLDLALTDGCGALLAVVTARAGSAGNSRLQ
jgi:hypothetical protein